MPLNPFPYEAYDQIHTLIGHLRELTRRDPDQEVRGIAVPVLDSVLTLVKDSLGDHPVATSTRDFISQELIDGEPVRASDVLLVAAALAAAIGEPPPPSKANPYPRR